MLRFPFRLHLILEGVEDFFRVDPTNPSASNVAAAIANESSEVSLEKVRRRPLAVPHTSPIGVPSLSIGSSPKVP